jgi:hypothetical protein
MHDHQRQGFELIPGVLPRYRLPFRAIFRSLDAPCPLRSQQLVSRHVQIHEGAGGEQAVRVLHQPLVAHLHETEDVLDDTKGMLDLGTHPGLVSVLRALDFIDHTLAAAAPVGHVLGLRRALFNNLRLPLIGPVTPNLGFVPVQQVGQDLRIGHVGGSGHHRVDQLVLGIDANVRLHAEVPLLALLGLVHVWIPLLILVLGRGRRGDDGGVDDGAAGHLHALRFQVLVYLFEQLLAQMMLLQQVPEAQDGGLVRRGLASQVDADEAAHGGRVVDRFFRRRVGEVEPLLQEVDAQHALQAHRRPAAFALGIKRRNHGAQFRPRHHAFHVGQKCRAPRGLGINFECAFGKGLLSHSVSSQVCSPFNAQRDDSMTFAEFP